MSKHSFKRSLVTKGRGSEPLPGVMELEIDWPKLVEMMGKRAARNGSGKASRMHGLIKAKWTPE